MWRNGGATVWNTPALDPELGLIYFSTGNAGPDFNGGVRPGDNLYSALLANPDKFVSVDGHTGDYNQFWLPDRVFDNRTSLITDPPDGRVPAMLPAARERIREGLKDLAAKRALSGTENPSAKAG